MIENRSLAPIVLFVYNRPTHTKCTIEGILQNPEASQSTLYIFSDGIKPNANEENIRNWEAVRSYIKTIKGFKDIIIEESEYNKGLAQSIIYGCTKVINKHGKIIMFEDDIIPSPFFLSYVNECLNKYQNDNRIWSVCGYVNNNYIQANENEDDIYLVNRSSSWGFGTWKRCWDKIIWDKETLRGIAAYNNIIKEFDKWGGKDSSIIFFNMLKGKNSSWAIRYHFTAFLNNMTSIYPQKSLIKNIGWDGSGTHCGNKTFHLTLMDREIIIPDDIKFNSTKNIQLLRSCNPNNFSEKLYHFCLLHPILYKKVLDLKKRIQDKPYLFNFIKRIMEH